MKNLLTLFLLIIPMKSLDAQTVVSTGNVSGTWTKTGSPYKVTGEIIVQKGSTLTIEPGAVVEFQGAYSLTVDGQLKAIGKKNDSITFKASQSIIWTGILFIRNTQTDTIRFNYCRFENVGQQWKSYKNTFPYLWQKNNVMVSKALFCVYSSPLVIKNCSFYFNRPRLNQANLVYVFGNVLIADSLYITSSSDTISSSTGMIQVDSAKYYSIKNIKANSIKDFNTLIRAADCNGIMSNLSIIENVTGDKCLKTQFVVIRDSDIGIVRNINLSNGGRFGIILSGATNYQVNNCIFRKVSNAIGSSGTCTGSIVSNILIEKCGLFGVTQATFFQSSGLLIRDSKFIDNIIGFAVTQEFGNGTPIFLNCNFQGNNGAGRIEAYPVFINCNFQDNFSYKTLPEGNGPNIPYTSGIIITREFYNSRPYFYNCLFWGNKDSFGHGNNNIMYVDKIVKGDFTKCIIQGDSSDGIVGYDENTFSEFSVPKANLTYNNSNGQNPGFIDSTTGNYQLLNTCNKTAYAINKGMSGNLLIQYPYNILLSQYGVNIYNTTDLLGNPRIADDTIDIGCYESIGNKKVLKLKNTYNDTTVCYGAGANYNVKTMGAVQSYLWQHKSGSAVSTVASGSSLTLVNQKSKANQYRLMVSNNECLPLKDSSRWFTFNVNNPVKKGITKNPNRDSIYQNETMQLTTNATGYASLLWNTGSTAAGISFLGSSLGAAGKYRFSVEGRKTTGCLETDTVYIITKSGNSSIQTPFANSQLTIYPQPATDILNISGFDIEGKTLVMQIYTLDGKLLLTQGIETNEVEINTAHLQQGIYLMTIADQSTGEMIVVKWVKG
ncbi:MAG: T9SS type A sorting domain-containing protein [Bacteroidota bacterium]